MVQQVANRAKNFEDAALFLSTSVAETVLQEASKEHLAGSNFDVGEARLPRRCKDEK